MGKISFFDDIGKMEADLLNSMEERIAILKEQLEKCLGSKEERMHIKREIEELEEKHHSFFNKK